MERVPRRRVVDRAAPVTGCALAAVLALGIATAALAATARPTAVPVVGFLRSTPAAPFAHLVVAFREGLREAGFVEGENVAVEYRWADNDRERLLALAAELVRREVAVIVGNSVAVEAVRAATATIPIVFVSADDPVKSGLVQNLARPDGNVTGITFFGGGQLGAKRMELLHEAVPGGAVIAVLLDPGYPGFRTELPSILAAGRALGHEVIVVEAASAPEFEAAFAQLRQAGVGGVLVGGSPVFTSHLRTLVALAARHAIPAIYDQRAFVASGGLMSYAASFAAAYRQAGVYAGRILKGARPSELPVVQPTTFDLVINARTARTLGLTLPLSLRLRAGEIIE
jgi:putative ABC transport system substrate-binding protein